MPKVPLRFSLATLLLLATIVCLSAALWSSSRQREDAKEELEERRNELGYLTITDGQGHPGRQTEIADGPVPGLMVWIEDSKKAD